MTSSLKIQEEGCWFSVRIMRAEAKGDTKLQSHKRRQKHLWPYLISVHVLSREYWTKIPSGPGGGGVIKTNLVWEKFNCLIFLQKLRAGVHTHIHTPINSDVREICTLFVDPFRKGLQAAVLIYQTASHLKSDFPQRHHEITDIFFPSPPPYWSPQDKYHNSKPFKLL